MLEQRRLEYLQAMGITQWMPRKPLAHAPEPRWWPQQAANADQLDETTAALEPVVLKEMQALVENTAPAQQAQQKAASALPPLAVEPQPIPEFKLYFLACQMPIIWVASTPTELALLQRFVFALQKSLLGKAYHLYEPLEFTWPFLRSSREDQSEAVALQALKAQWQVFAQQRPVQAICFDADSAAWLAKADVSCLLEYSSVAALLSSAEAKKQLWITLSNLG